jgi:hypothetical protein
MPYGDLNVQHRTFSGPEEAHRGAGWLGRVAMPFDRYDLFALMLAASGLLLLLSTAV